MNKKEIQFYLLDYLFIICLLLALILQQTKEAGSVLKSANIDICIFKYSFVVFKISFLLGQFIINFCFLII